MEEKVGQTFAHQKRTIKIKKTIERKNKDLLLKNGYIINFILNKIEQQRLEYKPNFLNNSINQFLKKKVLKKFSRNITESLETIGIDIKVAFRLAKVGN